MYSAMQFVPTGFNDNVVVRAVRTKPFKSFDSAVRALNRTGREGYVKMVGHSRPVYNNLKVV